MSLESDNIYSQLSPENLQREIDAEEKAKIGELAIGVNPDDDTTVGTVPETPKEVARQFWGEALEEAPLPGGYSKLKQPKRFRSK